jgi:hypothetical protein
MAACTEPRDFAPTARRAEAISSPRRVVTLGAVDVPLGVNSQAMFPIDGGLVYFAPEPFFTDGSGRLPVFLGDLTPGPFSVGTLNRITAQPIDGQLWFGQRVPNTAHLTAFRTDGTLAGTGPAFNGAPPILQVVARTALRGPRRLAHVQRSGNRTGPQCALSFGAWRYRLRAGSTPECSSSVT